MGYRYAVIDIETTGLNRFKDKINYVGIGLAEDIGAPIGKQIICKLPEDKEKLEHIFFKLRLKRIALIWQGGKFDTLFLSWHGFELLPIHHDTMLMGTAYELSTSHKLKEMAMRYLGVPNWDVGKKVKTSFGEDTEKYLGFDLEYTWELFCYFWNRMSPEQLKIYKKLLKPAYLMYRRAERTGVYFDSKKFVIVRKKYKIAQDKALAKLKAQHDISWNSPVQVSKALFEDDGLPVIKLSKKTGRPSSDAGVLKRLKAKGYPIANDLLEYKKYYGANTKSLNRWPLDAQYTGRVHSDYSLTNTRTGRTACSNPNLQQVPREKELRQLFTAGPGRILMEADYSQIELRVASDEAKETNMMNIFKTGGDIHTETAMSVSGVSIECMTKELRTKAKAVNFGFLYGMGAKGFVNYAFDNYEVVFTRAEAERYRELFFIKYPGLVQWHKDMAILCELQGGVYNRFGQFRALPDIYSHDEFLRSAAIRRAINTPTQGTASGLLVSAATQIDKELRKEADLWVVGTVHDSILMDCLEDTAEELKKEVYRIMVHPKALDIFEIEFGVPIDVDIALGPWGVK